MKDDSKGFDSDVGCRASKSRVACQHLHENCLESHQREDLGYMSAQMLN